MQHILCDGGKAQAGIDDENNCTVRALAITAGIPYKKADEIVTSIGRKRNHGLPVNKFPDLIQKIREHKIKIDMLDHNPITIQRFIKENPIGRFFVCTNRHALAICDGVIYDAHINKPRQRLLWVFKIESKRLDLIKSRLS